MITFKELGKYGSLGNQMFQFAVLYAAAKRNNLDFKIPKCSEWYNENCARNISQITNIFDLSKYIGEIPDNLKIIKEKAPFYYFLDYIDSEVYSIKDNTNLAGYFQNYKYFDEYRNDLIKIFSFSKETKDKVNNWLKQEDNQLISVAHIRRGDYLRNQFYHPVLDINYYRFCESKNPDRIKTIYVSDDKEYCKDNGLITTPQNFGLTEDLYLMTIADYLTIANSTLSWWGAYLNNKAVEINAPRTWFGSGYSYSKINYPNKWQMI